MSIKSDINRYRNQLIQRATKKGLYENFGQKEVQKLRDKHQWLSLIYGDQKERDKAQLIDKFDDWCMNYTG